MFYCGFIVVTFKDGAMGMIITQPMWHVCGIFLPVMIWEEVNLAHYISIYDVPFIDVSSVCDGVTVRGGVVVLE